MNTSTFTSCRPRIADSSVGLMCSWVRRQSGRRRGTATTAAVATPAAGQTVTIPAVDVERVPFVEIRDAETVGDW